MLLLGGKTYRLCSACLGHVFASSEFSHRLKEPCVNRLLFELSRNCCQPYPDDYLERYLLDLCLLLVVDDYEVESANTTIHKNTH